MNPYKAIVAPNCMGKKDVVPASKYIGIHHCSIEFNSTALKSSMQGTGGLQIMGATELYKTNKQLLS